MARGARRSMARLLAKPQWAMLVGAVLGLAGCSAENAGPGIGYVTGVSGPEDLVAIPGTRWIITSGLREPDHPGALYLVDRERKVASRLFPGAADRPGLNASAWPDCPGPPDPRRFSAHGLSLHWGTSRRDRLYVMNHGEREAIEIFAVATLASGPVLSWEGCVPTPPGALGNGVTALPDGTIAATLMNAPEFFTGPAGADHPENWIPKLSSGQTTGYAATWRKGEGWKKIPGTEGSGPNGIEAARDGSAVWVALWGNRRLVRAPLVAGGERLVVETPFMPDNLRWGDDGRLWVAGAASAPADYFKCWATKGCRNDYAIAHIDPVTLTLTIVPHPETRPTFGEATAVLRVGREVWIGANPSDRVAWLRLKD